MLTHKRLVEVLHFDPSTGVFTWLKQLAPRGKVGSRAGCADHASRSKNRRFIRIDGTLYLEHRLAWFYVHGEWPPHLIDHRDRDASRNAMDNLRSASHGQNAANTAAHRDSQSGVKGVHWSISRRRWVASIGVNGRVIQLGRFTSMEAAKMAYAAAAEKHFGEFARAA